MEGAKEMKTIKPESLGGFPDFLPELMTPRQKIIDIIRETYELFGFLPQDTPCLERSSVLGTDDPDFKMEVYRFNDGFMGTGQDVTLRFDLTVPLARVVAANPQLLKPYKRYQFGKVFRKEKPQANRFREFAQFDADIVGNDSQMADAEIIVLMYSVLKNIGVERFIVKFNNRKILNGLPEYANFPSEKAANVFRVLDKLEKDGLQSVIDDLGRQPEFSEDEDAIGLSEDSIKKVKNFLAIEGGSEKCLDDLKVLFSGVSVAEEGIAECEEIVKYLTALNIPSDKWQFDVSIARGLGYYTGPVFETFLTDIPDAGSVFSGGRFDGLAARFTGENIPATGASIGVDRLITALDKVGALEKVKSIASIMVTNIDGKGIESFSLAQKLRQAGVKTEVYLGKEEGLKGQIIYAAKREIPFLVILGGNEIKSGKLKLKDMVNRTEELLTESELIDKFKKSSLEYL